MYCPYCSKLIEDDFVLPAEAECPHCGFVFYLSEEPLYGDMLEDGFAFINPYDTEEYV